MNGEAPVEDSVSAPEGGYAARRAKLKKEMEKEARAEKKRKTAQAANPTDDDLGGNFAIDPKYAVGGDQEDSDGLEYPESEDDEDKDGELNEPQGLEEESSDEDKDEEPQKKKAKTATRIAKPTQEEINKAQGELPYTFDMPPNYAAFLALTQQWSSSDLPTIISRITACHHINLAEVSYTLNKMCIVGLSLIPFV